MFVISEIANYIFYTRQKNFVDATKIRFDQSNECIDIFRFKVVQPRKIRPQAKIHNFASKNNNIVIEEIIKIFYKKILKQKNNVFIKFYFQVLFFISHLTKFLKIVRF